jgi:hypothetical protein
VPWKSTPISISTALTEDQWFAYLAQTEHPEACWKWLTFLSEQAAVVQGVPARRSVAESDAYRQQMGAETADVYLATLENSEQVIETGHLYWDTYQGRVLQAVILALQSETVEDALKQVQQ